MIDYPIPLLGFSAYSGTGKTTLLTRLLPILKNQGLRIAVVKHAHHLFEIDHPKKDSYALRKAGAAQMLVTSRGRMALISESDTSRPEPGLACMLGYLDPEALDLVLVEGFKREPFNKIELHRPSLGKPLLCHTDPNIVAVATDETINGVPHHLPILNLNNSQEIAGFIRQHMHRIGESGPHDQPSHRLHRQLC
ncbi:MAG: molybdopterin-guanine dinucleotide biosynthesis protein B [Candidatus Thiodiazotropha sp. (ex Epidulcina cf. delphinae)]|nr:molybdopterin-guanine dinucleotide biosynthesis protein B [Candidatus Thiodiazotropha sp. (ex Epidulcina cf. delphinae)]